MSELRVAADLTMKGYDVYLGFSGQYDMIATKSGLFHRVEVKTSRTMRMDWARIKHEVDILAIVSIEGRIEYRKFRP
jgi:Holliday junction resolvase-like predicted endonuclease